MKPIKIRCWLRVHDWGEAEQGTRETEPPSDSRNNTWNAVWELVETCKRCGAKNVISSRNLTPEDA